jgi:hypothetical protein
LGGDNRADSHTDDRKDCNAHVVSP